MTWLFIRFYLGVLAVLFAAWWVIGIVFSRSFESDQARVYEASHAGGARLVASRLLEVSRAERSGRLDELQQAFEYPLFLMSRSNLSSGDQRRLDSSQGVVYVADLFSVVISLDDNEVLGLGPFPNYTGKAIEDAFSGWMKLIAQDIEAVDQSQRSQLLGELRAQFEFPLEVCRLDEIPEDQMARIGAGAEAIFYGDFDNGFFAVLPFQNGEEGLIIGPLPQYENISPHVGIQTLALVLFPAAIAIAILLRPVAKQLQQIESAAKSISTGDLSARVDERKVPSAKQLATAFNQMAGQTEVMVRTQRELLQAVSHELRTPLSRIRFGIDLVETASSVEQRQQRLLALDQATEELDDLVEELLQYVRLESVGPNIRQEQIAIEQTIETLVEKHTSVDDRVEYKRHVDSSADVFADRVGLHRVLGNLLSNASRFAKTTVTISARTQGDCTVIEVSDDGIGIEAADRDRVFEPFIRLKQEGENGGGVGLGLALVKRIMEVHGGRVEIDETRDGGCRAITFWPRKFPVTEER